MPQITAYRDGCRNASSICMRSRSNGVIDVRLSGIDLDDITAANYQLGIKPYAATKTIADGGIIKGDDGLIITLDEDDTRGSGLYAHSLELTDSAGTYKVFLSRGRVDLQ